MKSTLAAALAFLAAAFPASAEERPAASGLPGVSTDLPTALPEAEPQAEAPEPGSPTHFRVGDWDVRVSGSVSYTIGFGDHPFGDQRR